MRRLAPVAFLSAQMACGGGTPTGNPPPPPPPPIPAGLVILAGDGQEGAPGGAVPVRPAVVVRDAGGRPLANVAVTFAVDSGGGSATGTNAVSGSDGVATVGEWRLGPEEGRQVLAAAAGSLPPVRFAATAVLPLVTLPPQVVSSGGGTVSLTQSGTRADGLQLIIPPNALTAAATITFAVRSSASSRLPSGVSVAGPIIRVSAPGVILSEPVLLRVPIPDEAGALRVVSVVEPGTGRLIPLPLVERTAEAITVALSVLDRAAQGSAAPSNGAVRAFDPPETLEILATIMKDFLREGGDIDTGFRPGVDDWDFRRQPIAGIPDFSPGPTVDPAASMIESARWYFVNRKAADGPLWQRFREVPGIPESNRRGFRWVGVAGSRLPRSLESSRVFTTLRALYETLPGAPIIDVFASIKHMISGDLFLIGGPRRAPAPVPVRLFAGTSPEAPRFALAYRSVGRTLELALPEEPGKAFQVEFVDTGIKPFTVSTFGGGTYTVTGLSLAEMDFTSGLRNDLKFPEEWSQVAAGTIGDAQHWRKPKLKGWFLPEVGKARQVDLDPARVLLLDDFEHWWECVGCPDNGFRVGIPDVNVNPLLFRLALGRGGPPVTLPEERFTKAKLNANDVKPSADLNGGFALYLAGPGSGLDTPQGVSWFDWTTVRYGLVPVTLAPADLVLSQDSLVEFTAEAPQSPTGATYQWIFDGAVREVVDTDKPRLTYRIRRDRMNVTEGKDESNVKVQVRVLDADGRPVGEGEQFVRMTAELLAWKFTAISVAFSTAGPNVNSDGRWLVDSTRFLRMRDGGSQGGIRLVERAFTPTGFPVRTAAEGLYLLEGAALTKATVTYPPNNNTFATTQFAGASLALAPAPRVYGWEAVRALQISPEPTCKDPSESFLRTGSATTGRVAGLTVQYCWDRFNPPQPGFEYLVGPRITIATDVTFSGPTATGTITLTYLFAQPTVTQKKIATVTFTAARL